MSIVYDDAFDDPRFEELILNGKDGAWDLWIDGDEDGDSITFENAETVDQWLVAVVEAAKKAGISLTETLEALR